MSILGDIVGGIIGGLLFGAADAAGGSVAERHERRKDRRLLAEGKVKCGIRAVKDRVHNIGTEWSVGIALPSAGHFRFIPEIGIVGNREIDVVDLHVAGDEPRLNTISPSTTLRLTTAKGDLYWAIPTAHVDEIVELVRPADRKRP